MYIMSYLNNVLYRLISTCIYSRLSAQEWMEGKFMQKHSILVDNGFKFQPRCLQS